ncbi:hypothetical protein [Pseudomonas sp. Q11]|uniref:hypothetical protein n=1 Tax=Pseudomonas sp. Q11 TaxID=2968470 RepID=UPI00210AF332|nr:hypothetical protein [Pseudomonas sp. Q11]MCQ6257538.1 hypothetical protein [Pseudomonas sp. Q11]
MSANRKTLLCRYHYDPVDRLADCTPSELARTQRFYLNSHLTSEITMKGHGSYQTGEGNSIHSIK